MIYIPYAGVGSRRTPVKKFKLLNNIGKRLDLRGLTLRSGGANGADKEFERLVRRSKEIYRPANHVGRLPHGHLIVKGEIYREARKIAAANHPFWGKMSPEAKELHTRNVFQVLGGDLESYSLFVLCWTLDGADGINIPTSADTGGTGTAIRIANSFGIPVINLNTPNGAKRLQDILVYAGIKEDI